jgi:hypothetical protein
MHAGQRRKGDQPRIVAADRGNQVESVRDEQQIGRVAVRLEDARQVGDANRLLSAVVLDEQDLDGW